MEVEPLGEDVAASSISWSTTEVAEELTAAGPRSFLLPGPTPVTVHELDFADGGTGARVWDSAIALSIWLTSNADLFHGKRLLELGAGVGLSGISAALAGADVTLSELGEVLPSSEQGFGGGAASACSSARLLPNLDANLRRNALGSSTAPRGVARTLALNWEACLEADYEPAEAYDVVLGSDLIYAGFSARALTAALMAHTAPAGVAYLMSARTRFRKSSGALGMIKTLKAAGSVSVEPLTIHSSHGRTEVSLMTWVRAKQT